MSAYIMQATKISAIATAIAGPGHALLALKLCAENINSISTRYPDTKGAEVETFMGRSEQAWLEDSLVYDTEKRQSNEMAAMIREYCCQSCEHDGWSTCGLPEILTIHHSAFEEKAKEEQWEKVRTHATESTRLRLIGQQILMDKKPDWATHAIVATLKKSKTDTQSDYWGSSTTRTVVLAWSKHARNLFPEMRKAARNCPQTEAMAETGVEHRENYSMGRGTFLTERGGHYASGWEIRKQCADWIDARDIGEHIGNYCAG